MDLFPITIAQGNAFCNRRSERKLLSQFILNGRHTVVVAPRRYGKTSLINQTLLDLKLPSTIIELTMATSIEDVEKIIINSVSRLLYAILPSSAKAKQKVLELFAWMKPEISLTAGGQKINFHPDWGKLSAIENTTEVLRKLDDAAGIVKVRIVVVMDEFQQLSEISSNVAKKQFALEAAIRNAMQYSKNITYIFSGSYQHMLLSMFNEKSRPFYNSCEVMLIERIKRCEYEKFIQNAAMLKWNKPLPAKVLAKIIELTELHSNYVNRLCGHIWLMDEFPSLEMVSQYWDEVVMSKRSVFIKDILSLSSNQRRLLSYLARHQTKHPSGIEVVSDLNISESSLRQALVVLSKKDHVFQDSADIYQLLDPAMRYLVNKLSH